MEIHNSLKISTGAVIKIPEMLKLKKLEKNQIKTKKLCKHSVKKLPFVIRLCS